jgi:hypothetical protein
MEANNGYEYRIVKVRRWAGDRARQRAISRAATGGWEVLRIHPVDGIVPTDAVTLRRASRKSRAGV